MYSAYVSRIIAQGNVTSKQARKRPQNDRTIPSMRSHIQLDHDYVLLQHGVQSNDSLGTFGGFVIGCISGVCIRV